VHQASVSALEALEADYELVRLLGSGGMADVYLGRDRILEREVAIKIVRPGLLKDAETMARFAREARTVARLVHPGLVTLFGARQLGPNGLALIMAYCAGGSLKDLLKRSGPLSLERTLEIATQVAAALDHAHAHGVVHRDVKPENIFFDVAEGRALLSDFGIATAVGEDSLTVTGSVLGTPHYMAPEQIRGADVDGRTDQYALGCVLWECLAGAQPWAGESLWSVVSKQENTPLPDVRAARADIQVHVAVAIARAVAKDSSARFANCAAFVAAMQTLEIASISVAGGVPLDSATIWLTKPSATVNAAVSEVPTVHFSNGSSPSTSALGDARAGDLRSVPISTYTPQKTITPEEFVRVEPGTFLMGSLRGQEDERPPHDVTLTRPFFIQRTPVTQAQWMNVMGRQPSRFIGFNGERPVENISWLDAQLFLKRLNASTSGRNFRLPTEAEWEYAARAGSTGEHCVARVALDDLGWTSENANGTTQAVGKKLANAWGLYDVHGNVWEWVSNWFENYWPEAQVDPQGPDRGRYRVLRGGSWTNSEFYARTAFRLSVPDSCKTDAVGLRLAMDA
jgi:formylglycine-generating enzyme required for sulfatase activity/tRNA A-37 threonylcarbamoyl transferase component Bud32